MPGTQPRKGVPEASLPVIVAICSLACVGMGVALAVFAFSGRAYYCPKPSTLPSALLPAAAIVSAGVFFATIPEGVRLRWGRWAIAAQVVSFLALVVCFFAWQTGGLSPTNCGD